MSVCESESLSIINQLDGNASVCNSDNLDISSRQQRIRNKKIDKITAALNLPIVASYNLRSLMPKIQSLKTDILERSVDLSFLQEIWEKSEDKTHQFVIESMLEIDGLQYISTPRPTNAKGKAYGGAAIVINNEKFSCEKLNVFVPSTLEVVWG